MAHIDQNVLENLIACRDLLAFTLTDQRLPPEDIAAPMQELHQLLHREIEEAKRETGFVEPEITFYGRSATDPTP